MSKLSLFAQIKTFITSHLVPVIITSTIVAVGITAGAVAIVMSSSPEQNVSDASEPTLEQNHDSELEVTKTENNGNNSDSSDNQISENNTSSDTQKPIEVSKPTTSSNQTTNNQSSQNQSTAQPDNLNNSNVSNTPNNTPNSNLSSNLSQPNQSGNSQKEWKNCGVDCEYRMENGEIIDVKGKYKGETTLPVYSWSNLANTYIYANPDETTVKFECYDGATLSMSYTDFMNVPRPNANIQLYWCYENGYKNGASKADLYDANGTWIYNGGYMAAMQRKK